MIGVEKFSTCDPSYYQWTQKLFIHFLKNKLAYRKKVPVNWCPELRTTLANEEVIDGKSERGGHPVVQKKINQWILKITAYAEKLLKDLDGIDWPHRTKEGQKNWIGKSYGLEIYFPLKNSDKNYPFLQHALILFLARLLWFYPLNIPLLNQNFQKIKNILKSKSIKKNAFQGVLWINKKIQPALESFQEAMLFTP